MDQRKIPWKAEWKAAGLDPGPLTPEEDSFVPGLIKENERFLSAHPFPSPSKVRRTLPFQAWAFPLAAAAAAVFLFTVPLNPSADAPGLERMKGSSDAVLTVYRQGPSGTEILVPGAIVHPGDVLQAAYRVSQTVQGALLSVDGSRNVTIHLAQNGRSTALTGGPEHPLDFSYELDRAPKFEVFILFVSTQPFDLEPLRQTLKTASLDSLGPEAFGKGIQFTVLPLNKEASK